MFVDIGDACLFGHLKTQALLIPCTSKEKCILVREQPHLAYVYCVKKTSILNSKWDCTISLQVFALVSLVKIIAIQLSQTHFLVKMCSKTTCPGNGKGYIISVQISGNDIEVSREHKKR